MGKKLVSLKLVLGRAGSGKTAYCLQEITALVRREPRGVPLILLVPEQATLLMEKALARNNTGGMMRAQVLSFQRLVRRLFNEVRGGCRLRIGEVGRLVMLTKILLDHRQELRSFASLAASPGLAESVSHMITELRTYRIFPHDLRVDIEQADKGVGKVLADKLHDVTLIYRCYNEATLGIVHDWDYDMEEGLSLLPEADFLRGAHIWVDGFKGFTPQEHAMLAGLLGICGGMTVTLPLDPELLVKGSSFEGSLFSSNGRIFESVLATYNELRNTALETDAAAGAAEAYLQGRPNAPVFLSANMRKQHPMLVHLERHFGGYPVMPYHGKELLPSVEVHVQADARDEVVAAVRRIWALARDYGYQWHEMAVMTRGLSEYQQVLEQELKRHGVPFFMDDKRRIQGHPLLTLVQALLNLARRRWQVEDVFCALRTGFFPLAMDAVDRLENLCLATRIRAEDWERGRLWFDEGDDENENENYDDDDVMGARWRRMDKEARRTFREVSSWLGPLVKELIKGEQAGVAVRELSRLLLEFLEKMNMCDLLNEWAEVCEGEGDFVGAQIHRQIWRHLAALMEQMDTLLGDVCLSLAEYAHIVDSGLRSIRLGVVPPRLDEVMVGAINRTRLPEVKVVFLLGCVQGLLPPEPGSTQGLFDAQERAALREVGISLDAKGKKDYDGELFDIYAVLAAPSDKLILSYPLNLNGSPTAPSFVVAHLRQMFPGALFVNDVEKGQSLRLDRVLSHELALLETYIDGRGNVFGRNSVYESWLLKRSPAAGTLGRVLAQAEGMGRGGSGNGSGAVPRELTRMLYGQPFVTSVSQTQLYEKCPFAHFVHYGLKGRERKLYRLEASDAGVFSHALMNEYARMLFRAGENWYDVSAEEAKRRLEQIAEDLVRKPAFAPLVREARHRYMLNRQKTVLEFSVQVLSEQARAGNYVTIGVETSFGDRGLLPALRMPLEMGDELVLGGQIDRVDMAHVAGRDFVRVVDYKARPQKLSLEEMTAGFDLQLPLYLGVALSAGLRFAGSRFKGLQGQGAPEPRTSAPGGLAYFALTEPVIEAVPSDGEADIEALRRKSVYMDSIMCDDPRVAEAFGEQRLIKRDGTMRKNESLNEEAFAELGEIARSHLRRQGEEIMSGCVGVVPARSAKTHACRLCGYHRICGFDPALPGFNYRYMTEGGLGFEACLDRDAKSSY